MAHESRPLVLSDPPSHVIRRRHTPIPGPTTLPHPRTPGRPCSPRRLSERTWSPALAEETLAVGQYALALPEQIRIAHVRVGARLPPPAGRRRDIQEGDT
eukprot:5902157-Prymnesium_polylepis.3